MTKVLFICHGNICRSPMAQCVFTKMIKELGIDDNYIVDSCATSTEEIGNYIYPPVVKLLVSKGVEVVPHTAKQIKKSDFEEFDYIIAMDSFNVFNLKKVCGKYEYKIAKLLDCDIEDPWYTDNYEKVYNEITHGCKNLIDKVENNR